MKRICQEEISPSKPKSVKRNFDVAFLTGSQETSNNLSSGTSDGMTPSANSQNKNGRASFYNSSQEHLSAFSKVQPSIFPTMTLKSRVDSSPLDYSKIHPNNSSITTSHPFPSKFPVEELIENYLKHPDVSSPEKSNSYVKNSQHWDAFYPYAQKTMQTGCSFSDVQAIKPFLSRATISMTLNQLSVSMQNMCAKCNLSFRMTSDLVYHMRTYHKRESDPLLKKRDHKLRCTICHESFRERHHLTRHMSAHDDKEDTEGEC